MSESISCVEIVSVFKLGTSKISQILYRIQLGSLLNDNLGYDLACNAQINRILETKFYLLWTETCRNWYKLFTRTCYFSQVSHALNFCIQQLSFITSTIDYLYLIM